MVVTGPENIFYLTGQQTPGYYTFQALVLPVDGEPAFVVRQLEYFNFIANTFISRRGGLPGRRPAGELPGQCHQAARLGLASASRIDKRGWFLPIATYEALQDKLGDDPRWRPGIIEQLRIVKSPAELEKIATAATYVDAGMRAGLAAVKLGGERQRPRRGDDGRGDRRGLRICRHGAAGLGRPPFRRAARHLAARQDRSRTSRCSSKWRRVTTATTPR